MRPLFWILPALVLLCTAPNAAPAGSPPGFQEGPNQGISPAYRNKELTFDMKNGDCQKRTYGDGRGESDCKNGNSRSRVNSSNLQMLGRSYEYAMDIWIDPTFKYDGKGWGSVNYRSRLTIAEWQRVDAIKNHMYEIHLDSRKGAMFEDKLCFSPREFGQWNSFVMKVKWSNGSDGVIEVACNGKVIYSAKGPNAIPPGCGQPWKLQCIPEYQDLSKRIQWQVGPMLAGHGVEYARWGNPSQFPPFPEAGIHMKMRNLYYGKWRN